jgi:general secretion pathway protein F
MRSATLRFTELLLVLLKGNTGLVDALHILAGGGVEKPVGDGAAGLLALMKKGRGFSESLRLLPEGGVLFSPLYISLLAASELTGDIALVLERIAADLRRKQRATEQVVTMLLYPSVIVLIALIGTVLLIVRGLPLFVAAGLLSGAMLHQALSGIIAAGAVLLLGGAALFFAYFRIFYVDSPEFSIFYMLDFLLSGNVPLLDALAQCIAGMQRGAYGEALITIKKAIASGVPFSRAFAACKRFSPYVVGWLSVADTQGNVGVICANIRDYYAQKDARVREIAAKLIEPAVIVLTGAYLLIIILTAIIPVLTYAGGIV